MPTYEYKCVETGVIYEVQQKITENAFTVCQKIDCECKGNSPTHRIISKNIGVILNGTGFYETDYVRKNTHNESNSQPTPACKGCSDANCPNAQ